MYLSRLVEMARFGGIAFVVLTLGGFIAAGDAGYEDGSKIAAYFAGHRERILVANHVAAIGLLAFVAWAWWIMNAIERLQTDSRRLGLAIFVSASMLVAVEFGCIALTMTLALIANKPVDPSLARALVNGAQDFSYVEYFPQALLLFFFGAAILETRLTATWLGWLAFALVPLSLIGAVPGLGLDAPVALLTSAWFLAASILALRAEAGTKARAEAGKALATAAQLE
ncbi:MAG TPA: hypothetical protein PKI89_06915 [Tepidiformaceae bacterium]|nr:hypothetical protein [Tepidiformaceae bacterium]